MKSKIVVGCLALLLLMQACVAARETVSPPTSQEPVSGPIISTTVAGSTLDVMPPPSVTETPLPGGNSVPEGGVTLQDNGKTINLKVGNSFLLNLGTDRYDWDVRVDDESVLRLKMGVMVVKGAQGIYEALSPGTTRLNATGSPLCLKSRPACAMPSILFSVTVVVE